MFDQCSPNLTPDRLAAEFGAATRMGRLLSRSAMRWHFCRGLTSVPFLASRRVQSRLPSRPHQNSPRWPAYTLLRPVHQTIPVGLAGIALAPHPRGHPDNQGSRLLGAYVQSQTGSTTARAIKLTSEHKGDISTRHHLPSRGFSPTTYSPYVRLFVSYVLISLPVCVRRLGASFPLSARGSLCMSQTMFTCNADRLLSLLNIAYLSLVCVCVCMCM
ncbi:unnamed protein product [Protopolystoma xenopodis]|uniref:Uncharacterized protein n=1 Tax=Protopolystoma xenopodis TaxID=117903 RepID=A0A3S5BQD7_9PLAT|nr:unnamed protein product [Protopolystoma xenopodis]